MLEKNQSYVIGKDYLKFTGLHWAVKRKKITTAKILLEENAYVDCKDQCGFTPLYYALTDNN